MASTESHIAFETVERMEAYVPGTGLAVWEIAWVAEAYDGNVEKTAEHLSIDCALAKEALAYAAEHVEEIGMHIYDHVCWDEDDFRRAFPRATVVQFDPEIEKFLQPSGGLRDC